MFQRSSCLSTLGLANALEDNAHVLAELLYSEGCSGRRLVLNGPKNSEQSWFRGAGSQTAPVPLVPGCSQHHPSFIPRSLTPPPTWKTVAMLPLMKIHWHDCTIPSKFASIKFTCAAKQLAPHISYSIWTLESESVAKERGRGFIVNGLCKQP